jgi:cytochrome P450
LQDLFGAGAETTANTIEWAMKELIHNPEKMKRVHAELGEIVRQVKMVEERDTEHLPCLCTVIKEVL